MGRIWLTSCLPADAAALRLEIEGREPAPRVLRVGDLESMASVARALEDEGIAAAIAERGSDAERIERVVGELAGAGRMDDILVVLEGEEPGAIARYFHAGATEVIAAASAVSSSHVVTDEDAHTGGHIDENLSGAPAADDDDGPPGHADAGTGGEPDDAGRKPPTDPNPPPPEEEENAHQAHLLAVVGGRGGCGRTTIATAMAVCAARAGLRVAVLDLDLMFGDVADMLGLDGSVGIEGLSVHAEEGSIVEQDIEATAMRVGPGLTLWGPCSLPEHAELMGAPVEQLVGRLRALADLIVVDTASSWSDAAAMAVAACDRCLVVGSSGPFQVRSAKRVIELACRLGVPKTRMTGVFNRIGAKGCGEDQALHFEIGVALRSRARIAYGGEELAGMASFGHLDRLMAGSGAFARSIRSFSGRLLQELGCPIDRRLLEGERRGDADERPRIRLPWVSREEERP